MTSTVRILVALALAVFTCGFLLPTAIAVARNHPSVIGVLLWNTFGMLLLGLGWLIALVIALKDSSQPQFIIQQTIVQHQSAPADKE